MSKKMMLLALSVVSAALFALPAVASATPAHIDLVQNGTVSPGAVPTVTLETDEVSGAAEKVECHEGVTGPLTWDNTTTGKVTLTFHGCTASTPFGNVSCNSSGAPAGTIVTTTLPFHLVMIPSPSSPGVLITPGSGEHFATFFCFGLEKKVTGNGVLGTITSPACNVASNTAVLKFEQGATGFQKHATYTGVTYGLKSNGTQAAQIAEAKITFAGARKIICT